MKKQLAVHLHLYYMEQLPIVLKALRNIDEAGVSYDLFVTLPETAFVPPELLVYYPKAKIIPVPNRGYDIGALIAVLHRIEFQQYEYILKLHTKGRSMREYVYLKGRRFNDALWSRMLWEALTGSPQIVRENLQLFADNPKLGMLGCDFCVTEEYQSYQSMEEQIEKESLKLGFEVKERRLFVAGTMFLCRMELLKPFLRYQIEDFEYVKSGIKDNTLAHVLERLLGWSICAQGYEVRGVCYNNYMLRRILPEVMRFFFQKKRTKTGKTLIKVCKIPVYNGWL